MSEATARSLFLLSPYRPPTSYPVTLAVEEIEAWLSGYAALWHPLALLGAEQPPQLASTYDHDQPMASGVYSVVNGPNLYLAEDWFVRAESAGSIAIAATADRVATVAAMVEACKATAPLAPEIIRWFAGVGFGYLMLETLYDAMEHEHLLDAEAFWASVQTAALATVQGGSISEVRTLLVSAAEKLQAAREIVASSTPKLLDFAIPTPEHLGAPWPLSLKRGLPITVIGSGQILEELNAKHPERIAELKKHMPEGLPSTVDIATGCEVERDEALLPTESVLWNLQQGQITAKRIMGVVPEVAGRYSATAFPQLPSLLVQAGFRNAMAVGLNGKNPFTHRAASIHWPGLDGQSLDAFAKEPLIAHDAATYFNFAYHLHQAVSSDSTPTLSFAHTGLLAPASYDDLLAVSELAAVFGEWLSLNRFFADTHAGEYVSPAGADDHVVDILDDRVTLGKKPDAVGEFPRRLRLRRRVDAAYTFAALARSLADTTATDASVLKTLETVESDLELHASPQAEASLVPLETDLANRLAARVVARGDAGRSGYLVLNPCGYTRRVALEIPNEKGTIPIEGPVKAVEFTNGVLRAVVEVPSCGFTWIPRGSALPAPKPKLLLAEGTTIRNEFVEAEIDPATGGLRAMRDVRTRQIRLGQMLVYNPGSTMKARAITITNAGTCLGEIESVGDIVSEHNDVLATFKQRLRVWIGRPVIEMRIELTPVKPASGYAWHSYFGCRFAWRDDRAAIFRGIHSATMASYAARPGSTEFIEVRFGSARSFVFTGGLPFAQKVGGRMFDVILAPEGEATNTFEFMLAMDRDNPAQTAQGWVSPVAVVPVNQGPPPSGTSGWLANVDLPSLLLTSLKPTLPTGEGMTRAVMGRFIESAGFGGTADLAFARTPARAFLVNAMGETKSEITLTGDSVGLEFSANELFAVRAEW